MILYTIGNTKLGTVELVSKVTGDKFGGGGGEIQKVIIFHTAESREFHKEQSSLYRKYLGNQIRIEEVMVDSNGLLDPNTTAEIFKEKRKKIIDITNGQKTTAALLYMVASLLDIEFVFYIKLKVDPNILPEEPIEHIHYEYIKVPTYNDLPNLAKISHFDLIYYLVELNKIFDKKYPKIDHFKNDLITATVDFFAENSAKNIIISAASCEEVMRKKLAAFLKSYPDAIAFATSNGIDWNKVQDEVGGISRFFSDFSKSANYHQSLSPLVTSAGLLSALRNYRNLAAHWGNNAHDFKYQEARVAINLSLELFRIVKSSPDFWKYINE